MGALDRKIAVITGGCSGLGAAMADLFEEEGARIVIADVDVAAGQAREARSPGRVRYVKCNVTREADVQGAIVEAVQVYGGLDILVNNAGKSGTPAGFAEMNAEDWDAMMAVSPRAVMLGIKHAIPVMKARGGGSIINTASVAGMRPGITAPAYSVAKAAILFITQMAAYELATENIRVNALCPGVIPTPAIGMSLGLDRETAQHLLPEVKAIFSKAQPLARAGTPDDVARAALFLASDASSFITGRDFVIDGGLLLKGPGSMESDRPGAIADQLMQLSARSRAP